MKIYYFKDPLTYSAETYKIYSVHFRIAIAPFQIILLHTIDGITTVDLFSMWLSSCGQGLSSAFGIIASLTSDVLIANTTLILSLLLFSTIYMDLLGAYRHFAKYKHELSERRKNFAPRITGLHQDIDQVDFNRTMVIFDE